MAKITFTVSDRMDGILTDLAKRDHETKSSVIRRAIALLSYLEDEVEKGGRVVVRGPEEDKELVIRPGM
ncbi:MAG: hypothetical protein ACRD0K_09965 [Egibacteraceae bacterium]